MEEPAVAQSGELGDHGEGRAPGGAAVGSGGQAGGADDARPAVRFAGGVPADPITGLTPMQHRAALGVARGLSPTEAARQAGYQDPKGAAKDLRKMQTFTDFVLSRIRGKIVKYHEILELSKQNIVYLLSDDETEDKVRAAVALGVLRVLAKSGKGGSLIESALEEDKVEADPRTIAQRLLTHGAPALPGQPKVIEVEVIERG